MIELLLAIQLSLSSEKLLHTAIAASMIAHGADLSTTSWAIGKDPIKFKEANPILRPLSDDPVKLAVGKMGLAVGLNYALIKLHTKKPKTVLFITIVETVAISYVANRNAKLVREE